jgi:endonuclease YncB( thermonuclease family)
MKYYMQQIIQRRICLWLVRILLASVFLFSLVAEVRAARVKKWRVWENCEYVPNKSANDGDSFWLRYKKRRYKIRLYFVDTPETSEDEEWAVARLKEQADYFGTDDIIFTRKVGERATKFTEKTLRKGFTVYTRLDEAMGRGKTRYYAMVKVDDRFLSELLTERGYVRINKRTPIKDPLPEGLTVSKFERRLHSLENKAKRANEGGWAKRGNQAQNTVQEILRQREKQAETAEEFEPRIVTLEKTTPVYSVKVPGRLVRMLRPGTKVKAVGAGSPGMVRIRFNPVPGKIYEVQCRRRDVGMR